MKVVLSLAKVLTLIFWALLITNFLKPFNQPFNYLLLGTGALIVLLHAAELWLYRQRLAWGNKPRWAQLQTLLFGMFYVYPLAALPAEGAVPSVSPAAGAVNEGRSAELDSRTNDQSPQQELKLEGGNA